MSDNMKPLTRDIADGYLALRDRVPELEAEIKSLQKQLDDALKDRAFYKSCALSGERPASGAEPSAKGNSNE